MKQIPLTQGQFAIVDDEDYPVLSKHKWHVRGNKNKQYAARLGKTIYMHRAITSCPKGMEVDHINGNGLDNRRSNLRVCTNAQNKKNVSINSKNKTGYKGVYKRTDYIAMRPYVAQVKENGRQIYVGAFETAELAALAYDKAAAELYGEFAKLNFPDGVK